MLCAARMFPSARAHARYPIGIVARLLATQRNQLVKEMRARTSAPIKKCVDALAATGDDLEAAIDWLRKAGIAGAQKKADRGAHEGAVSLVEVEDAVALHKELSDQGVPVLVITYAQMLWDPEQVTRRIGRFAPCLGSDVDLDYIPRLGEDIVSARHLPVLPVLALPRDARLELMLPL